MPTILNASAVKHALIRSEVQDPVVYHDYSGRGMFGAQCFALRVSGAEDMAAFIAAVTVTAPEVARELASRISTDTLGMDMVVYFPGAMLDGPTGFEESEDSWDDAVEDAHAHALGI